MAARLRKTHQDDVRAKIQASQLINRLQKQALGKTELTRNQIDAIKILLGKVLPDLKAVELSGDGDNPVAVVTKIELVDGDGES
jgi:hypothetical protein